MCSILRTLLNQEMQFYKRVRRNGVFMQCETIGCALTESVACLLIMFRSGIRKVTQFVNIFRVLRRDLPRFYVCESDQSRVNGC
jgi:hypothetical protein